MTYFAPSHTDANHASGTAGSEFDSTPTDDMATPGAGYHLRILFGPLTGVDILLPDTEVFFHVGDDVPSNVSSTDSSDSTPALVHATNVLYVPYPGQTDHFRLRLAAHAAEPTHDGEPSWRGHTVEFIGDKQVECKAFSHNAPLQHGVVAFAVKHVNEAWSDAVLNFAIRPEADDPEPGSANVTLPFGVDSRACRIWVLALLGILFVLGLTGLGYWQVQRYMASQHVANVASLLSNAPGHNTILPGRDGAVHVVSETEQGAEWDRQALLKASPVERAVVTSLEQERARLAQRLSSHGVRFVTVRLNAPTSPTLVVLDDEVPASDIGSLEQAMRRWVPYTITPCILRVSPTDIVQSARAMLDAVNAHYRIEPRPNGVTFDLLGSPTDTQLATLQDRVLQFSRSWGTHYVNFNIAMRSNRLNGKSYWDGEDRYILNRPDSWYFPQPLKGII
ncbi:type III secretion system protein PrgH/EprH [Burkholderia ambifaria IOP40-10]|uniref:Type III secretion system protein PrgH/EprH n=1 Tax=Burkholderia ambifaria IOP40-10 TaxID=396596 RepID=B1FB87_9BURK|nr:PrgH/EprH family type III secretion apparatus protein [Burkholderia ambifaria]EDT05169.1 type III secretion system protein PrgH/EprH [Burkholderia ambifaria IOP40-10]